MTARYDLVISNGLVIDGTGAPGSSADIGIKGDRIAAVADLSGAIRLDTLDASGFVVAPGFVDSHVHSEFALLATPPSTSDLYQGVTTHIVGQDGTGFAPSDVPTLALVKRALGPLYDSPTDLEPASVGEFLRRYDGASTVNVATLIPNGSVRGMVVGSEDRPATAAEMVAMVELCREGMRDGAVGLSSGLDYAPSGFASTDELIALASAVAEYGGIYVSHIRYADGIIRALHEAVEIGRRSGAATHISHLRPERADRRAAELLEIITTARSEGQDVTYDGYPFTFGCTSLTFVLPRWMKDGSEERVIARLRDPAVRDLLRTELRDEIPGWNRLEIAGDLGAEAAHLIGLPIGSAANATGKDPVDFVCDLLIANRLQVLVLGVDQHDSAALTEVKAMLSADPHMACSDGIYASGRTHPRRYGAFARLVGDLVRGDGFLLIEKAVQHATRAAALRHGLDDRGLIRAGMAADVAIFDPATFSAQAITDEHRVASGMKHVVVNGQIAMRDSAPTGALPGRGLRRPLSVPAGE